jgi:hypothetical protein
MINKNNDMKAKLTAFVIFILIAINSFSQAPNWSWAKSFGSMWGSNCLAPVTDRSGNMYLTGMYGGPSVVFGDSTFNGNPGHYLLKMDPTGNVLWAKNLGDVYSYTLCTDDKNNVLLCAPFLNTLIIGIDTIINPSIIKYDSSGNIIWATKFGGGLNASNCTGMTTDNSHNIYICGSYTGSNIVFGGDTLLQTGTGEDAFIVKFDSLGVKKWIRGIKGINTERSTAISADTSGNVLICGTFGSPTILIGTTTLTRSGTSGNDFYLVKYDGNVIFAYKVGGLANEEEPLVKTDGNSNVFLTGTLRSPTVNFSGTNYTNPHGWGAPCIFIAKYNSTGNFLWVKGFGGNNSFWIRGLSCDTIGNPYISGVFDDATITLGTTTLTNHANNSDVFIAKFDIFGNVSWAKSIGGINSDYPGGVAVNSFGNIYLAGYFYSPIIYIGNFTLPVIYTTDIYVACMLGSTISSNSPVCEGNALTLHSSMIPGGVYSWTGPNGFSSSDQNPVVSSTADTTMTGSYYLYVTAGGLPDIYDTIYLTVYPIPPTPVASNNSPVCEGFSLTLGAYSIPGAIYQWTGPLGFDTIGQNPVIDNIPLTMSGMFYVTASVNGCVSPTDSTNVIVKPIPNTPVSGGNGPVCLSSTISLTASTISGANYSWTGPAGYTSTDQNPVVSDSATAAMEGFYYVSATVNGCTSPEDSVEVIVKPPLSTPNICMVSTDSASGYNVVVWNKPVSAAIDHFNIYTEGVIAGTYILIGSVPYDSLSVFSDSLSNPAQQAYLYKISVVDTCGIETAYSTYHKTIHLNINLGIGSTYNLIWNFYEGFAVPSYKIYRGLTPSSMSLMNIVSASLNSYTDLSPPPGMVYYQIESVNPNPCSPEKSNYLSTKSNLADFNTVGIKDFEINKIYVYPNPVKQILNIQGSFTTSDKVFLYDVCDREIPFTVKQTQNVLQIDVSGLSNGIYFLKIIKDNNFYSKKIIINH